MHNNTQQDLSSQYLDLSTLPKKPYCCNDFGYGLKIRPLELALEHRHIQLNPPSMTRYLVFDVDRSGAALAWEAAGLPTPSWVASNPVNGHAHVAYSLDAPVCTSVNSRPGPARYLAAVQAACGTRLDADRGYGGLITKNPLHDGWRVWWGTSKKYGLGELAEYVPDSYLARKPAKAANKDLFHLGRNCCLFDELRQWAYRHRHLICKDFERYQETVLTVAHGLNANLDFAALLPEGEVRAIAKSVSKFVYQTDFGKSDQAFSGLQKERNRRSVAARAGRASDTKARVAVMLAQGMTHRQIADALGVTTKTVQRATKGAGA